MAPHLTRLSSVPLKGQSVSDDTLCLATEQPFNIFLSCWVFSDVGLYTCSSAHIWSTLHGIIWCSQKVLKHAEHNKGITKLLRLDGTRGNVWSNPAAHCYEGFYPGLRRKRLCFATVLKNGRKHVGNRFVLCHVPLVTMNWPLLAGKISVNDWAAAMESVLQLELPWRMLRSQLAQMNADGEVDFMSCFYDLKIGQPIKEVRRKTPPWKSWRNSFWCNLRHKANRVDIYSWTSCWASFYSHWREMSTARVRIIIPC